jgi:phosphoglycolate phosphatase-like HAD superfamily hydrolase
VKHVLFWDIDGTLLTTGRAGVFALEEAARDVCGSEIDLSTMKTAGLTDGEIAQLVIVECGGEGGPAEVEDFLAAYEGHLPNRLHWRKGRVLDGVEAVLDHLQARDDVLNLLLTGNTPAGAKAKLAHYGLDGYFSGGTFCAGFERRDSIARRARDTVSDQGADPDRDELFVIGDTPHDVSCGKVIEAKTIAVASGSFDADELARTDPWLLLLEVPDPRHFEELLGIVRGSGGASPPPS